MHQSFAFSRKYNIIRLSRLTAFAENKPSFSNHPLLTVSLDSETAKSKGFAIKIGAPMRKYYKNVPAPKVTCPKCGTEFTKTNGINKFCSKKCSQTRWSTIERKRNAPTPEALFWSHVNILTDDKCWEWKLSRHTNNFYGRAWYKGKHHLATHIAWSLANKKEIPAGMEVCHKYDNPPCCNPNHLFLATHKENMNDAKAKHRLINHCGEKHGMAKLSWKDVNEIRDLYKTNIYSHRQLSKIYGVGKSHIARIIQMKVWNKHE